MLTTNYPPTVGFMNTSILAGPHSGTLRRVREYDSTPPRILSKIDVDPQYYYGWPLTYKTPSVATTKSSNSTTTIAAIVSPAASISTTEPNASSRNEREREHEQEQGFNNGDGSTVCPPPGRTYCF